MGVADTITPTDLDTTRRRALLRDGAIGALAATGVNLAIWAAGRAAERTFLVNPPGSAAPMRIGFASVALTTLVMFAVGIALFGVAARRSQSWGSAVVAAGVGLALLSAGGGLTVAEEASTGVLLASMHVVTGAAFAVVVSKWRSGRG